VPASATVLSQQEAVDARNPIAVFSKVALKGLSI
jgi:hypothetical protein